MPARWPRWARMPATSPVCCAIGLPRATRRAAVLAIDPAPKPALVELAAERQVLELIRRTSLEALPEIDLPDVVVIDGDHNYWTVTEELRLIAARASGPDLPLILLHDVGWPHGRRDDYFAVEQIPEEHRQPVAGEAGGHLPRRPGPAPGRAAVSRTPRGPRAGRATGCARRSRTSSPPTTGCASRSCRPSSASAPSGTSGPSGRTGWRRCWRPWDDNGMVARLEAAPGAPPRGRRTPSRPRSGRRVTEARARRPCCAGCSNPAPSRWPSGSRGCA